MKDIRSKLDVRNARDPKPTNFAIRERVHALLEQTHSPLREEADAAAFAAWDLVWEYELLFDVYTMIEICDAVARAVENTAESEPER